MSRCDNGPVDLRAIYLAALARCDPSALVASRIAARPDLAGRPVVALGKCAMRMAAGLARGGWSGRGIAIVPAGYETGERLDGFDVVRGSHPGIDEASFRAGDALLRFATSLEAPALVLLSGGASAAAESPLAPRIGRGDVARINELLVRSGLPIATMNLVRKHLSAIKGGRLALALPEGSETWILSDVPPGRPELVGSGPTCADASTSRDAAAVLRALEDDVAVRIASELDAGAIPDTPKRVAHRVDVLADNETLVRAAAGAAGERASIVDGQMDDDVEEIAGSIAEVISTLAPGSVAVAGGEPTVAVRGTGTGGRCSELALRLLRAAAERNAPPFAALIASSDGRDGNSGAAGYLLAWDGRGPAPRGEIDAALAGSDAHPLAARLGAAIDLPPTGNNLRDIMMMARR